MNPMKVSAVLAAVTLASLVSPAQAQLTGELGVLDPENANGGINPATGVEWAEGDMYRLAFYTEEKRDALSNEISDYNTFVQTVAAGSATYPDLGSGTWKVLGSTATVGVRDNTGTNEGDPGAGLPIFVLDGTTMIAENSADMWDGFSLRYDINDPENPNVGAHNMFFTPYLNEDGEEIVEFVFGREIATGSTNAGDIAADPLGDPNMDGARLTVGASRANSASRVWLRFGNRNPASDWSFYALSDPLTVTTGGGSTFVISEMDYDPALGTVALTWQNSGAESYIIKYSLDMQDWDSDLGDGITAADDENQADPDNITLTFDLSQVSFGPEITLADELEVFFRVEEQE